MSVLLLLSVQVKEVFVREGDSIGEDEVILEFYPQEQESKAQQKQ